jgi:hypothetical protein
MEVSNFDAERGNGPAEQAPREVSEPYGCHSAGELAIRILGFPGDAVRANRRSNILGSSMICH